MPTIIGSILVFIAQLFYLGADAEGSRAKLKDLVDKNIPYSSLQFAGNA